MQKILFITDEGWPIESAPAVRIHAFKEELQDQEVLLLQGAKEKDAKEKRTISLKRPSEKKILQFTYFLLKLNYTAIKVSRKEKPDAIVLSIPKYELLLCVPLLKTKKLVLDIRDSYKFIDYHAYLSHFFPTGIARIIDKFVNMAIGYLLHNAIQRADIVTVAN